MRAFLSLLAMLLGVTTHHAADAKTPNIVWLVTEDISPNLGCYGDPDAITPNLDKLASQGVRFQKAFTHCPVCAPTRSGMIAGQYATTLGSHHMRSKLLKPPTTFTEYLQKAGYVTFWPGKTDFNFEPAKGWVNSKEDWTKNPDLLPKDKPFFAYVNFNVTHESQARATDAAYKKNIARLKPEEIRDRSKLRLPPYYPDAPEVRECVGKYHDNITAMDYLVGDVLKTLDDRKLAENTVVFFWGDHGWGLSRGKRWPYESGARIPLLVRWPGQVKPGSVRDDLIEVIDFAPTVLSLAGAEIPPQMQGRVFLGSNQGPTKKYAYTGRDRMDETYDRIRSLRNERYRYIRNFHPELPYAQWINYMDEMPIMKVWRQWAFEGKLNDVQKAFMARTKPKEELYDLENDPYETKNLAENPVHEALMKEFRTALDKWIVDTKDLGAVSEQELIDRGLVKDVLNNEYAERKKLHPKTSPVP